jgi:cell division protein ZapA
MPSIEVAIAGRKYRMACEDGQEEHLRGLAEAFDGRIAGLKKDLGEIGDARLTVVAALMLADELFEAGKQIEALRTQLGQAEQQGLAAADRAQATQAAVVAALNAASERIERVTRGLNQGLGDNVPMG